MSNTIRTFSPLRTVILLVGAGMATLAVACSSDTKTVRELPPASTATTAQDSSVRAPAASPTSTPSALPSVLDKGFYLSARSSGGFTAYYAFTVQNPDPKNAYESISYQVSFFDESNKAIGANSGYVSLVLPGAVVAESSSTEVLSRPARFEVVISKGRSEDGKGAKGFAPVEATYQPPPRPTASGKVLATVFNPFSVELKNVEAVAILLDAGGKIIGGDNTYISVLPPSGNVAVSFDVFGQPPLPARVVVYPALSSLTILDLQNQKR